jgi:signal transduction histidine kinase
MRRPWHVATLFCVCLAVVLAAMGWVSVTAWRLNEREAASRYQAALEERVRLALWRMDSAIAPLLARENGRPYFAYTAFYPVERAYTRMFSPIEYGDVLVPSPLLIEPSPHVLLYFQLGPDGALSSPQVPLNNMRDLAETRYVTAETIDAAASRLAAFQAAIGPAALSGAVLEPLQSQPATPAMAPAFSEPRPPDAEGRLAQRPDSAGGSQKGRGVRERSLRAQQYQQQAQALVQSNVANLPLRDVHGGVMTPVWVADALLLARRVRVNGDEYVQGCWLDWPAMKADLLARVADLLPEADLQPTASIAVDEESRQLAAVPVQLIPGEIPASRGQTGSPILLSLAVAWACVVLAAVAVAVLLAGTLSLSERRGAFVSAVTHELRTPLTAFRLYTDMLTDSAVDEEGTRRRYLETLRSEAGRLQHLVENVLAYARLERGIAGVATQRLTFGGLLERVGEPLQQRAAQGRMELTFEVDEAARDAQIRVDPSALERILFNLVDNACKYAASADQRAIRVAAVRAGGRVAVRVCDRGPGIAQADAKRLFRPFHKSAREAAHSAPGVGLGLALSRRLARAMGGDLYLDETMRDGACFVVTLPIA